VGPVRIGCVMKPRPMGIKAAQSSAFAAEGGVAKEVLRVNVVWAGLGGENGAVECC
jgi:hypothetical protein